MIHVVTQFDLLGWCLFGLILQMVDFVGMHFRLALLRMCRVVQCLVVAHCDVQWLMGLD